VSNDYPAKGDRDGSVDNVFRFKSFTPKVLFRTLTQPLNTLGEIRRVREDVPTPNSPGVPPDIARQYGDEVFHCPGAK